MNGEVGDMSCKCGGAYGMINGRLTCVKCGLLAPYQPVTIEKLIAENEKLKADNAALHNKIAFYKKMWLESSGSD